MKHTLLYVYTDGGSRGNPGSAALGVYITDEHHKKVYGFGRTLGVATNNVAEYQAVIDAFDWLIQNKDLLTEGAVIHFRMDSLLACMQILGKFRVKNSNLASLLFIIRQKENELAFKTTYTHIRREFNKHADAFVNWALDGKV